MRTLLSRVAMAAVLVLLLSGCDWMMFVNLPQPVVGAVDSGTRANIVGSAVPISLIGGGTQVTIYGKRFSTAPGATTFDFGPANPATDVTCSSTTQCTATAPPPTTDELVQPLVDVIATVNGVSSLPNPPYDQVLYFGGFSCGCGGD
jgi:hypothetical protein